MDARQYGSPIWQPDIESQAETDDSERRPRCDCGSPWLDELCSQTDGEELREGGISPPETTGQAPARPFLAVAAMALVRLGIDPITVQCQGVRVTSH
ncbi:hypothetical protein SKAU_G00266340 [Synaphobranchus kaupii]|uniref:Uncharacterized protein n=1 Tax=Synaphobranchus kaupii TaxID=118154 RepID=A0A9Q1IP75_SYNKA|nr:hypothetical protein SKAU_G00266340 [Synaphobranchus kaupii]